MLHEMCEKNNHADCVHTSLTCECDCHAIQVRLAAKEIDLGTPKELGDMTPRDWAEFEKQIDTLLVQRGRWTVAERRATACRIDFDTWRELRDGDIREGLVCWMDMEPGVSAATRGVKEPPARKRRGPGKGTNKGDARRPWRCSFDPDGPPHTTGRRCPRRFGRPQDAKRHWTENHSGTFIEPTWIEEDDPFAPPSAPESVLAPISPESSDQPLSLEQVRTVFQAFNVLGGTLERFGQILQKNAQNCLDNLEKAAKAAENEQKRG